MRIFLSCCLAFFIYTSHSYAENTVFDMRYTLGNALEGKGKTMEVRSQGGYGITETSILPFALETENTTSISKGSSGNSSSNENNENNSRENNNEKTNISTSIQISPINSNNQESQNDAQQENYQTTDTIQTDSTFNSPAHKSEVPPSIIPTLQEQKLSQNAIEIPIKEKENTVQITNTKNEQKIMNSSLKKERNIDKNVDVKYNTKEQKKYTKVKDFTLQENENFHQSALPTSTESPLAYYGIIISIFGLIFVFFNLHAHATPSRAFSLRKISR